MTKKSLLLCAFILTGLLAMARPVFAGLLAQETSLNASGAALEINLDSQGTLWVSDGKAGEIRAYNTAIGAYTIYPVGGRPTGARGDGAGAAWWADNDSNQLGRLTISTAQVDIWEIPEYPFLWSTAITGDGHIWTADFLDKYIYELDLNNNKVCAYSLPDLGLVSYMAASVQEIWLGDYFNKRLLRLDTSSDTFTWWQLPVNSYPQGIAIDDADKVWWADSGLRIVGHLDPAGSTYVAFTPPSGQKPQMIALQGNLVWLSLQSTGGIGLLDPAAASGQPQSMSTGSQSVTSGSQQVTSDCNPLSATIHYKLTPTSGTATWTDQAYPTAVVQSGWTIFASPAGAKPWGIAGVANTSQVYMVDQDRHKLARLPYPVQVKACKLQDADGDLATTTDQTPKAGWPVYLRIDGARQSPAVLTGTDGCATWGGLQPGPAYGVEEDMTIGWMALTPTSFDFGPSSAGQSYAYTFINAQKQSIYLPLILN